jgi:hypothetical protein
LTPQDADENAIFGWFSAQNPLGVKEWTRHSAALASFFARAKLKRTS